LSTTANIVEKSPLRSLPFTQQRNFRKTLNERVNAYLRDNGLPARDVPAMYRKTVIALAWWALAQIGGQTGDAAGALEQAGECLILLAAAVLLRT